MTVPTLRRPATAWIFLVTAVRALTTPSVTADCDRRVEELAAESRIVRAISGLADAWRRAASGSIVVRTYRKAFVPISSMRLADRVRAVAVVTGVAAATALLPYAVSGADERDPYTWVLPAAAGCAAALVFAAAEPVARAIVHRQS